MLSVIKTNLLIYTSTASRCICWPHGYLNLESSVKLIHKEPTGTMLPEEAPVKTRREKMGNSLQFKQ